MASGLRLWEDGIRKCWNTEVWLKWGGVHPAPVQDVGIGAGRVNVQERSDSQLGGGEVRGHAERLEDGKDLETGRMDVLGTLSAIGWGWESGRELGPEPARAAQGA